MGEARDREREIEKGQDRTKMHRKGAGVGQKEREAEEV